MSDFDSIFLWSSCCLVSIIFGGGGFGLFWLIRRSRENEPSSSAGNSATKGQTKNASSDLFDFSYYVKYSVLVMGLPYLHRNYRDISTPHYLNWLNQWLQPEFELDYSVDSSEMILSLISKGNRQVIYSGDFRRFPDNDIVNEKIKAFNDQQRRRLVSGIDDFEAAPPERNPIEIAFLEREVDEAVLGKLNEFLLNECKSAGIDQSHEIKHLIKFLAVSTLLPFVETGKLNLALDTFIHWSTMWLNPDLGLFILSQDPESIMLLSYDQEQTTPVCRTPLFNLYDCLYFAKQFERLSPDSRETVVAVTKKYLTQLPIPPVSHKPEPEARQEYEALIDATVIIKPPVKLAEKERGIGMLDTGIAGLWHTIQFVKCLLAMAFINDVKEHKVFLEGVRDLDACTQWCQQWLRPHWELLVSRNDGGELEMALFPLQETGTREPLYYQGAVSAFNNNDSPILLDMTKFDYSKRFAEVVQQLRQDYGNANLGKDGEVVGEGLIKIELSDPNLQEKVAHNDEYILEYFL